MLWYNFFNSKEFKILLKRLNEGTIDIRFKRGDLFFLWIFWKCKKNPSLMNLFGFLWAPYWILTSEWLWVPVSLYFVFKFSPIYISLLVLPFIFNKYFGKIGRKKLVLEILNNEDLFEDLWQNRVIALVGTKKTDAKDNMWILAHPSYWQRSLFK